MKRGFGLIEIVVGGAILATVFIAVSAYYQQSLGISRSTAHLTQASFLLEEGIEVSKIFRDESWTNISTPSTGSEYYLAFDGMKWATSTTNTYIDGMFERKLVLSDVYRDANDDIVSSGGTLDAGTRKATISVSWYEKAATTTKSISTYLTNIF
jgi:hypothetical protein